VQEQRIRCLLEGAWFPVVGAQAADGSNESSAPAGSWRFVRLSPTRRHLHYSSHVEKITPGPAVTDMPSRINVHNVSGVGSNVTAAAHKAGAAGPEGSKEAVNDNDKTISTRYQNDGSAGHDQMMVEEDDKHVSKGNTMTQLMIHGSTRGSSEGVLLELHTPNSTQASEWLDGLLMLLDQQPITADTNRMIKTIEEWSVKVRMLNLEWEDVDWTDDGADQPIVYDREGLDTDYWYDMGERKGVTT